MIPKIIHQIGPKDKNLWHPIWKMGHNSWKKHFKEPEFKHILWEDGDEIDNLVKTKFSDYWEYYQQLPMHMLKIDFARLCILYTYGGIFSDLDFYCYSNFYSELVDDLYLLESFDEEHTEVENPLIASIPNNEFFLNCLKRSKINYEKLEETKFFTIEDPLYEHAICGPWLIDLVYKEYDGNVSKFPRNTYNPFFDVYNEEVKTKHFGTGMWGITTIEDILERYKIDNCNTKTFLNHYLKFRIDKFPELKEYLNKLE
jgi:mannosyltransferase OCH1-like enzyme